MKDKTLRAVRRACDVTRPIRLAFVAIATIVVLTTFGGWQISAAALVGGMVAIMGLAAFQVHRGVWHLHNQSDRLQQAAAEAEKHYIEVLWRIVWVSESRDRYTEGHSERVAALCEGMARHLGLDETICERVKMSARLHDLGMLAVSSKILNERDRLGVDEYRTVKQHPEVAHKILKPLQSLRDNLPAIRHHHERMNGTGYPDGLSGDQIPIEARILAVADAYDAMTHDRPQRMAMTAVAAMSELERCTPAGYDPACVEALAELKHLPKLTEALAGA